MHKSGWLVKRKKSTLFPFLFCSLFEEVSPSSMFGYQNHQSYHICHLFPEHSTKFSFPFLKREGTTCSNSSTGCMCVHLHFFVQFITPEGIFYFCNLHKGTTCVALVTLCLSSEFLITLTCQLPTCQIHPHRIKCFEGRECV